MDSDAKRLVDEAIEAGILRQDGSHFYAIEEEGEDEHVGQGFEAAYAWLEDRGYIEVEEPKETSDAQPAEEDVEVEPATSEETAERYDPDAVYRHEGGSRLTFPREGRADGILYPGQHLRDLPVDTNETLQGYIDEGLLVKIE